MNQSLLRQYTLITEFLGHALGPDYEVVLHDLSDADRTIVAIANGGISGRTVGESLTDGDMSAMLRQGKADASFKVHYNKLSDNNKILRSSTLFIRDGAGEIVGMLCINFDDKRFQEVSEYVLRLCHPDAFVETNFTYDQQRVTRGLPEQEAVSESLPNATEMAVRELLEESGIPVERLTLAEKMQIIGELNKKGIFLVRGSVKQVAKLLHCSQASVYRYMSKIN